MTHALKTWTEFYKDVESGEKNFEVRRNDRQFKVGDKLLLQEWDHITKKHTGKETERWITYILPGRIDFGVFADFIVIGLKPLSEF